MPHFFNFTCRYLFRQKRKDSRNLVRRREKGIGLECGVDAREKVSSMALLYGRGSRPSVLIIDSTKKLGELRSKTSCLVDRQPVAHRV